jgi:cytochrome b involved in lipid metabolism
LHGTVYDLSDFVNEHPAGAESIYNLAGQDGTEAFQNIHSIGMLDDFKDDAVGVFVPKTMM